jgi:hypothetical protein
MQVESFFQWLGNMFGAVIRAIVDVLRYVLGGFGEAISSFSSGLAKAMGMAPSVFNFAVLFVGVLLLFAAIRAIIRGAILAFIIWVVLAVLVLGALIR